MYKNRWRNALKQLATINRFIKDGYIVKYQGEIIPKCVLKNDGEISELGFYPNKNTFWCFGDNDLNADNGIMYDSIEEFNKDLSDNTEVYKKVNWI